MRFYSDRERRLWLWTLVLVAGIYATLGLASTLAEALRDVRPDVMGFLLGMFLVAVTIVAHGLQVRPGGTELVAWLGIATVYILVFLRMTFPERSHLMEYGVVALFVQEALLERARHSGRVPLPWLLAILATALIGALDEAIQLLLPSRVFDWEDILFNLLAASMAVVSVLVMRWVRRATTR